MNRTHIDNVVVHERSQVSNDGLFTNVGEQDGIKHGCLPLAVSLLASDDGPPGGSASLSLGSSTSSHGPKPCKSAVRSEASGVG